GKYETARSSPLYLNVTGEISKTAMVTSASAAAVSTGSGENIRVLGQDISYLKEASRLAPSIRGYKKTLNVLLIMLALLLPALAAGFRFLTSRYLSNDVWRASHYAMDRACIKIAECEKSAVGNECSKVYPQFSECLAVFLKERFQLPSWAGAAELENLLRSRGLPHALVSRTKKLYDTFYQAVYAPGSYSGGEASATIRELRQLLKDLNRFNRG
ncbi:MAG: hypothetical protein PHQ23_10700, partial [Candidatus Wallbacteria bacterium]|nr:hypothetical protein [Candidatus Wallbacteria bacterium]